MRLTHELILGGLVNKIALISSQKTKIL